MNKNLRFFDTSRINNTQNRSCFLKVSLVRRKFYQLGTIEKEGSGYKVTLENGAVFYTEADILKTDDAWVPATVMIAANKRVKKTA